MRLDYFVLIIAVVVAMVSSPAAGADMNYRADITGAEDSDLASLLDKVSELKTLEDKPRLPKRPCGGVPIAISNGLPMRRTALAIGMRISLMTSTRPKRRR